jgi:uncharacterized protein
MIIDGHAHACGNLLTTDGILKALDENRVDRVVLVPGELGNDKEYALPNLAARFPKKNVVKLTNYMTRLVMMLTNKVKDIPAGNDYVYNLKTQANDRVIQFVWATTGIKNISAYLDQKLDAWNFRGVKLHQCWEKFSVDSGFFREVALWAEIHNMPLFIHLLSDKEAHKLIAWKKKHPKLKLIVAHLFGIELFIKANFKDEQLYFDTSPSQLVSDYRLKMAIEFVGNDKLLFGTDTPYGAKDNLRHSLNRIKNLDIPEKDKKLIMGVNMAKLLGIS